MFELLSSSTTLGRRGRLTTAHGIIETPFFMPVATAGAMKGITQDDLLQLGSQLLLANTYHLHLQPGEDIVAAAGGLHGFMHWEKPTLTDSGGFQVYSLRRTRKITDKGVHFFSHLNGDELFMGPEESITIQHKLGADMIMCFDECPPSTASRADIEAAVDRTLRWAKECKKVHEELKIKRKQKKQKNQTNKINDPSSVSSDSSISSDSSYPLLFGIIQGGLHDDLRTKCTEELIAMDFDGYAVGGLAVGESEEDMYRVLDTVCPLLPEEKPRYLMGVGEIEQLKNCVAKGIDMFDCVLPMRIARHGTILLSNGSRLRIKNSEYRTAHEPIDPDSPSPFSQVHLRSYLHHLIRSGERLGETIASMQNLGVTLKTMQNLRNMMDEEKS